MPEHDVFGSASRELRWHYQWILIDEFLPSLVGRPLVDEVLADGPRWFRPAGDVFIPLEARVNDEGVEVALVSPGRHRCSESSRRLLD